jgi:hypothetical protein
MNLGEDEEHEDLLGKIFPQKNFMSFIPSKVMTWGG